MKSETAIAESELAARAEARATESAAGEAHTDGSPSSPPSSSSPPSLSSPESPSSTPSESSCPGCGEALAGEFCHRCGEQQAASRDLSLRHFVKDAAQELTSVEHSKLWRTLSALLFKPGFLTAEWVAGRRRQYLKPLNLLLLVLTLNFFALSIHRSPTSYSAAYLAANDDKGVLAQAMDKWARRKGLSGEVFVETVNEKWRGYNGLPPLQVFNAFLFALLLALVYFFSKRYFVEHLVFSLHFLSFSLLTSLLLWPVYFVGGVEPKTRDMLLSLFKMLLDAVYLFFALRGFYERAAVKNLLRSVVLLAGYFAIYFVTYVATLIAAFVIVAKY